MTINSISIVGMGALGLMYADHIQKSQKGNVSFLLNKERMERYKSAHFTVNGETVHFPMIDAEDATPADLVIVATKYNDLRSAMEVMKNAVGENTVIISVLNGISSEKILAEQYHPQNIIPCVAIAMDAMRDGYALNYCNKGFLRIGTTDSSQLPAFTALKQFFEDAEIPYTAEEDIMHAMWGKFLLNVGINQTCMVYDTTYKGVLTGEQEYRDFVAAMREVIAISEAENINLTEDELHSYIQVIHTLNPDGYPSMRQDALAQRKSEVDMFAGTVLEIAAKHNIPVPVNEKYYKIVKDRESRY